MRTRSIICVLIWLLAGFGCGQNEQTPTQKEIPPVVNAGEDKTVDEGGDLWFEGKFNEKPGENYTTKWYFGDGNVSENSLIMTHAYNQVGQYRAILYVTDGHGNTGSDGLTVTVKKYPPAVRWGKVPSVAALNQEITLNAEGYGPGSAELRYEWDLDYDGVSFSADLIGQSVRYSWSQSGEKNIAVQVVNNTGERSGIINRAIQVISNERSLHPYGPEIIGLNLGMPDHLAQSIIQEKGFSKGTTTLTSTDPLWNEKTMVSYRMEQEKWFTAMKNVQDGEECFPRGIELFFSEGRLSGISFGAGSSGGFNYVWACSEYIPVLFSHLEPYDLSDTTYDKSYYGEVKTATRYFKDGYNVLRYSLQYSINEQNDEAVHFLYEGIHAVYAPPALAFSLEKGGEKTKYYTHIGLPVDFTAHGLDFVDNSSPKYEWDMNFDQRSGEFTSEKTGSTVTFSWGEPGKYVVGLKGTSENGKSTLKTAEIEVSPHEYKDENITALELLGMTLPHDILPVKWGQPIPENIDLKHSLLSRVQHVIEAKIYVKDGKFAGYYIGQRLPSLYEPRALMGLSSVLRDKYGSYDAYFEARPGFMLSEPRIVEDQYWDTENFYFHVAATPTASDWSVLEVLYKPLWSREELKEMEWYPLYYQLK